MSAASPSRRATTRSLVLVFAASGASALIFESLWFRQAGLAFGNGIWASSLVLAAFMAGLTTGSALSSRYGDRLDNPLRAFALLELLIAATGVLLVVLLPRLASVLAPLARTLEGAPLPLGVARAAIAFLLLSIPSTAMGMTLPLMVRVLGAQDGRFGRVLGLLYGMNTLGAVTGVVLAEALLLGAAGVHGTAFVAAGLDLVAAATAWRLASHAEKPRQLHEPGAWKGWDVLGAAFLGGFTLLALEVVWFRVLTLFVNDTPAAFAMVLAAVLTGIALGGFVASAWLARKAHADVFAGVTALGTGFAGIVSYAVYPRALVALLRAEQPPTIVLMLASVLVLPAALGSGVLFTLLGTALRRKMAGDAAATGRVTLANTAGAAFGPLIAGFVFLPALGIENCLRLLFALYGVTATFLMVARVRLPLLLGSLFAFAASFGLLSLGESAASQISASARRWMTPGDRIVEVRETPTATMIHVRHRAHGLDVYDQIATNAYSMTTNDYGARRYMGLFATLPLALHPGIQRALIVGYGIGNTAAVLAGAPELKEIHVADISRAMLELSRSTMHLAHGDPLDDPRTIVHIEDGRHFLHATRIRFDLITGEPPPPIVSGVENLYTREYFELVRERLAEGGFATYWLPMMNISTDTGKSIIAAFCAAFDDCSLWHGSGENFVLVGSRGARGPVSEARFAAQWRSKASWEELQSIGLEHPSQLGALFIGGAGYLGRLTAGALPLEDTWPKRMHQPPSGAKRAWLEELRDTLGARQRFMEDTWIRRLWPESFHAQTLKRFDIQRLQNDLLFRKGANPRRISVLDQVLRGTPLTFPVLLILNSDPDIQRAIVALPESERDRPELAQDLAAGYLAHRRVGQALDVLERYPKGDPFGGDLKRYLGNMVEKREER